VPNSETRRGRVGKGVAQTLDTGCNQGVMIGAFRGRNPNNASDRTTGTPTEQRLEINQQGTSNTITTVQKDNVVVLDTGCNQGVIHKYQKEIEQSLIQDICTGIDASYYKGFGIRQGKCRQVVNDNYKIRRLTPRECFRLMDFPDTFTWPVSDSQAYKQAGNSIVVRVLEKIIKNLAL
jgi:DNA (cytosine-5)-methyltransferase 1